jgi:hypothetical protein
VSQLYAASISLSTCKKQMFVYMTLLAWRIMGTVFDRNFTNFTKKSPLAVTSCQTGTTFWESFR